MRKRLLALILTGVLLGFSACGSTDTKETKEAGNIATEESREEVASTEDTTEVTKEAIVGTEEFREEIVSTEETTEEDTSVGTESDSEENQESEEDPELGDSVTEPVGESVLVWTDKNWKHQPCHYEQELGHYLFGSEACYDILSMNEDTYPALAKIVEDFNTKQAENAQEQLDRLVQMADEDYPEYGLTELDAVYEYVRNLYPIRTDKKVVSVLVRDFFHEDKRGEHFYFEAANFDVQSGKELTLADIFKSSTDWTAILNAKLQENHPTFTYDAQALAEENLIWTLGYKGVSVYFSGTDKDQPIKVSITYDEYPDIFAEDYLPDGDELLFEEPEGDYVRLLTDWDNNKTIVALDLYGDGKKDYIQFYYEDSNYNIMVNDNPCLNWDNHSAYFDCLYLVKHDGRYYLYLDEWWDNDIEYLDVFEITDYALNYVDGDNMKLDDFTDPNNFRVWQYEFLFASRSVHADCYVGPDGMPVPNEGVYIIDKERYESGEPCEYTSLLEITAELVDEQGNLLGETYTFPVGTEYWFIYTDCETYVDAATGDGRYCRLYIDWPLDKYGYKDTSHPTVNGMDAEACFGMLHFAG